MQPRVRRHLLHPLVVVLLWELRRIVASRASWFIAAGALGISFLIIWGNAIFSGKYPLPTSHGTLSLVVPYTSIWGLATTLPESPGIILGLFVPFLCVNAVARDLKRRARDLVMTTPLPDWAYVWGRYLASLFLSFFLAGLFLVSIVVVTGRSMTYL